MSSMFGKIYNNSKPVLPEELLETCRRWGSSVDAAPAAPNTRLSPCRRTGRGRQCGAGGHYIRRMSWDTDPDLPRTPRCAVTPYNAPLERGVNASGSVASNWSVSSMNIEKQKCSVPTYKFTACPTCPEPSAFSMMQRTLPEPHPGAIQYSTEPAPSHIPQLCASQAAVGQATRCAVGVGTCPKSCLSACVQTACDKPEMVCQKPDGFEECSECSCPGNSLQWLAAQVWVYLPAVALLVMAALVHVYRLSSEWLAQELWTDPYSRGY